MNIISIIKVKIQFLFNDHVGPPKSYWLLSLQWLTHFDHVVQSLGDMSIFGFHSLIQYNTQI